MLLFYISRTLITEHFQVRRTLSFFCAFFRRKKSLCWDSYYYMLLTCGNPIILSGNLILEQASAAVPLFYDSADEIRFRSQFFSMLSEELNFGFLNLSHSHRSPLCYFSKLMYSIYCDSQNFLPACQKLHWLRNFKLLFSNS